MGIFPSYLTLRVSIPIKECPPCYLPFPLLTVYCSHNSMLTVRHKLQRPDWSQCSLGHTITIDDERSGHNFALIQNAAVYK